MKRLSHFWRHVTINLVLGVSIEVLIHLFHDAPAVQKAENTGLDAAIAFFGARGGDGTPEPGPAFTLFDIDEPTWRGWQSPHLTPRDQLLGMLRSATGSSAAAVVVDLDLTGREAANGLAAGAGDSALASFLAAYRGPVPVVLVRLLESPGSDSSGHQLPAPVPAWFEPLPDSASRWIHWGTVQFVQELDGTVRRWRLWEPVCLGGRPGVLPSVQLVTGAAVDPATSPARLHESLARVAPPSCEQDELAEEPVTTVWGHQLRAGHEQLPERIIYSLPWPPEAGPTRMVRLADGSTVPMLLRLSAAGVAGGVDRRLLDGRIVVIGGSYAASRDWYTTPLGRMPGMQVIINAIASLEKNGQYGRAEGPLKWVVMVALLLITSLAYARYHPLVATLLILPLIYLLVLPISFFVFKSGAWLDFTAPVLGVQLHELIASAEDAWKQRGKRFLDH